MATDHPSETAGAIEKTELLQGSKLRQRKREKYLEFLNPLYWVFSQCILLASWANLTCIQPTVRVWDIHLTADKLPRRPDRIKERHKIAQRPTGSRNGTYTRVSARAGQRGSMQELINCGVKEGNKQWISHTSISEWTKQEEKKGRKSRRKEGKKKRWKEGREDRKEGGQRKVGRWARNK